MAQVRVTLYGGLNEIGGNKFLLEDGEDRILLDFGTSIGARNQYFEEYLKPRTNSALRDLLRLGLLPDIDGIYRTDLLEVAKAATDKDLPEGAADHKLRTGTLPVHGVLLTHAHVDHFQDISFLDPQVPIHCTATTRTMLEAIEDVMRTTVEGEVVSVKQRSVGEKGKTATFPGEKRIDTADPAPRAIHTAPEGSKFKVGPFEVVAVPVDHSVPGAVAFLVDTPSGKRVFYTGDVRFHGSLTQRTKQLHELAEACKPDLLLSEGTRIGADEASDNEASVKRDVHQLVSDCEGLAIAEFGWKDTTRFDTLQEIARETGRTLVVSPKLAYLLRRMDFLSDVPTGSVDGYDHVKVYLKRKRSMLDQVGDYDKYEAGYVAEWDNKAIRAAVAAEDEVTLRDPLMHYRNGLRAKDIREDPSRYLVHLTYFDIAELLDLAPPDGSRWVRCLTEPYSDEMALDLDRQKNWLHHFGLEHNVQSGAGDELEGTLGGLTHVSGHAAGADLIPFLKTLEADVVVPVHAEAKHLDRFEGIGNETRTFPTFDFKDAAAGRAVVEL